MKTLDEQLSAPRRQPDSNTPQPEEPLEINMPMPMPTPVTVAVTVASSPSPTPVTITTTTTQAPPVAVVVPAPIVTAAQSPSEPPAPTPVTSQSGPQAQFSYHDINIMSLGGLDPLISLNDQIPLLSAHPNLKNSVRSAIERSAQEVVAPVVDRTVKISVTTCEQIVKKVKDFIPSFCSS